MFGYPVSFLSNCTLSNRTRGSLTKVRPWKSSQGSVGKKGSQARCTKYVLNRRPDPRRASPAQQSLDLPISCLIKHLRDNDPPAQPNLALLISTITAIATNYRWTHHLDAVADLVTIAFFYLLRVGEYTSPKSPRKKQTIPLRKCDVRLWRRGMILQHSATRATLLSADSATICIANTKNGTKGAVWCTPMWVKND